MAVNPITVTPHTGGVLVTAGLFDEAGGSWSALALDDKRVLLQSDEGKAGMSGASAGLATCGVHVFRDFLVSLHHAGWSGSVSVDTGYGPKKVFFEKGAIAFAASTVIDDRLGEVIYREARISLDELTNSAAQVTKARKFGQVLIQSGIFTNVQLWDALKLQVRQILRSLFMIERVYFELQEGPGLAPTEVVFTESGLDLINECYSYGSAFRSFLGRLRSESSASVTATPEQMRQFEPGTFIGDLLEMINAQPNVQELLNASKLTDNYTVSALMTLVNLGLCKVQPEVEGDRRVSAQAAPLKARLDGYGYVLGLVRKAFADAKRDFPHADLAGFVASLNPSGFPALFIDEQGGLPRDCVAGLTSQCNGNTARVGYYVVRIESLIQFLLQVAGDNLEFAVAKKIRQEYRSVAA